MDKYIKRLQTRVNRIEGVRVTKSEVRQVYIELVSNFESPTDEEMNTVAELLIERHKQTPVESDVAQSPVAGTTKLQQVDQQTSPVQPPIEPENSTLTVSSSSGLSQSTQNQLAISEELMAQTIENQFGSKSREDKQMVLDFLANKTFNDAEDLQREVNYLANVSDQLFAKILSDYQANAAATRQLREQALNRLIASEQEANEDFFGNFRSQITARMASFGI
ncbi:MAG: hypothetical protein F6K58_22485 [Symploca sp. SIO2E9]|nr:hypothetical protein [Symploca sp. SIO2E9]